MKKLAYHLNLEWIFEGDVSARESSDSASEQITITPPSLDKLIELYNLAMIGDVMGLEEKALELKTKEHELIPFADKLCRLANDLLIEDIQVFLSRYMGGKK